jgi:hypothetical protein
MTAHTFSRPAAFAFTLLSFVALITTPFHADAGRRAAGLTVHEWGTFTSVVGRDGAALPWRPLSVESDLPSFVYSRNNGASWNDLRLHYPTKSTTWVRVRMETPVIFFYAEEETNVSVRAVFSGGIITEWYPQARVSGASIDWSHYYPARATDAAPLGVGGERGTEHEKFLFYRGVGDFDLPVSVRLSGDTVVVSNANGDGVGKVVLFENKNGKTGYLIRDAARGETVLKRPALGGDLAQLMGEMKAILVSNGLYEKEAEAMIETWRTSWFEDGLRVFYVVPRKVTDAVLPLTIEPAPSELVRVLVGRTELITPEMEQHAAEQLSRLDAPSPVVREAARKEMMKYGRFTETVLGQLAQHTYDPEVRGRAEQFIKEMSQPSGTRQ